VSSLPPPSVTFIDTNILIYSQDTHDDAKHRTAETCSRRCGHPGSGF